MSNQTWLLFLLSILALVATGCKTSSAELKDDEAENIVYDIKDQGIEILDIDEDTFDAYNFENLTELTDSDKYSEEFLDALNSNLFDKTYQRSSPLAIYVHTSENIGYVFCKIENGRYLSREIHFDGTDIIIRSTVH